MKHINGLHEFPRVTVHASTDLPAEHPLTFCGSPVATSPMCGYLGSQILQTFGQRWRFKKSQLLCVEYIFLQQEQYCGSYGSVFAGTSDH